MNEQRILSLIDECIQKARYIENTSRISVYLGDPEPVIDSYAIPASLWAQLVIELRPMELSRGPEEAT